MGRISPLVGVEAASTYKKVNVVGTGCILSALSYSGYSFLHIRYRSWGYRVVPPLQRKSPRLQGFDYRHPGGYFVTICTHQREMLFGHVIDGIMHLNATGQIAQSVWQSIPDHRPQVTLDVFVVMPNHIHGLLWIADDPTSAAPSLSTVVGGYKAEVTRQIRRLRQEDSQIVWQGRFHDRIIRTQIVLDNIRTYVGQNPQRWSEDIFYAE